MIAYPEYQGKGVNALMFNEFIPAATINDRCRKQVELEDNSAVHSLWNGLCRVAKEEEHI